MKDQGNWPRNMQNRAFIYYFYSGRNGVERPQPISERAEGKVMEGG